jgi:hypothetical protein
MRDEAWLQQLLDEVWDNHFADVPQDNIVRVMFGRRAKNRLGSIKLDPRDNKVSIITMNGLFRLEEVPEFVVKATLVHELCHYAHGFNSPVAQKYRYPHAGGVVRAEYRERGLEQLYVKQREWLRGYWGDIVASNLQAHKKAVRALRVPRPFWF